MAKTREERTCGPTSPYSGSDCVESLRRVEGSSSFTLNIVSQTDILGSFINILGSFTRRRRSRRLCMISSSFSTCFGVYGLYGLWITIYGLWFMIYGVWSRVWGLVFGV